MYGTQPLAYSSGLDYGTQPLGYSSSGLEALPSYGGLPPTVPAMSSQYLSTPQYVSAGGYQSVEVPTVPMNAFAGQSVQQYPFAGQYVQQPQYEAALMPQQSQVVVYEPKAASGALVEYNPNPTPVLNYLPTPNLPAEGGSAPNFGAPGQPAPVLTQSQLDREHARTGVAELERQRAMKRLAERGRVLDAFSNLQKIRNEEIMKTQQAHLARQQAVYQKQHTAQNKQAQKAYAQQAKDYEKLMKQQQKAAGRQH